MKSVTIGVVNMILLFTVVGCGTRGIEQRGATPEISSSAGGGDELDDKDISLMIALENFDYKKWASAYCSIAGASNKDSKKCAAIFESCQKAHVDIHKASQTVAKHKTAIKKGLVEKKIDRKRLAQCLTQLTAIMPILSSAQCGATEAQMADLRTEATKSFANAKEMDGCMQNLQITMGIMDRMKGN